MGNAFLLKKARLIIIAPMAIRRIAILVTAALSLVGCYLPMTFHETKTDTSQSPFENVRFGVASGAIGIDIKDTHQDLSDLKFVSATAVDEDDNELKLKLETKPQTTSHTAVFHVEVRNENTLFKFPFHLRFVTQLGSQTLVVTASFSLHSHTEIINWVEALDPGGQ
jgi:hypothetical protein